MSPVVRPRLAARVPGPALVLMLVVLCCWNPARAAGPEQAWIKPRADESLLIDIAHDRGRWIVVGERGHVLVSDDARDWRQAAAPTRVMLTGVDLMDGTGFAVGHDATIIRTRDNGESWELVYDNPEEQAPLLDVLMVDTERAIAVGAYGLYVETSDGGESWEQSILEPGELEAAGGNGGEPDEEGGEELFYDFHLNDIAVADNGRWYIAAEAGTVYRSDDRGASWVRLPSPWEGSFFGVLPLGGDSLVLFGLQGRLYRSDNAGVDWKRIETGADATLSSGIRLGGGEALIVGYAGIVISEVGAGGGPKRARLTNRPGLSDAYRLDNGDLLTVGEGGIRQWPADAVAGE